MDTDGGGWTVIQRRVPYGNVNFTRDWSDYEKGFGDLDGEFWYGLNNIHYLTTRDEVELRIDMVRDDNVTKFSWSYPTFSIAGPTDKYRLTIGVGVGTGHDAMQDANGRQFSTYDNDNDNIGENCAYVYQGGWWYDNCYHTNLNGPHIQPTYPGVSENALLMWGDGHDLDSLSSVEMKIRIKQCKLGLTEIC